MKNVLPVLSLLAVLTSSVYAQDTIQVKAGWNIIGSVKAGLILDVMTTFPDSIITGSFFRYSPGIGYQSTDTLDKGPGYWMKVKADGVIIFNNAPAIDSCQSKAFIYQGKFYNTVKIGNQCWMAENLDVGTMVVTEQTDNDTLEKYCYNDSLLYCSLYGGLYRWEEAMQYLTTQGTQGICPDGWHIPTYAEFQIFSSAVDGDGNALKAVGQGTGGGAGINTSGFSGLLAGFRYRDWYGVEFTTLGYNAFFWSSTDYGAGVAAGLDLFDNGSLIRLFGDPTSYGFSVRCLKD